MKLLGMLTAAAILATPMVYGQQPAPSPSAKVAERVGAILSAPGKAAALNATTPVDRKGPEKIVRPEPELPRLTAEPPLPPLPERKSPRPVASNDPTPLVAEFGTPIAPQPVLLPAGPLYKQQSYLLTSAAPTPLLGAYVKDRVSLADPSLEVSSQFILMPQNPQRTEPAPFAAWNLPDPFEHASVIRLRELWAENPQPPVFVLPPTRP